MTPPPALQVACWDTIPGLTHGFFGRGGGVSAGDYAGLNLSERVDDNAAAVAENRRRVAAVLASDGRLVWMRQVHGERVAVIQSSTADIGEADGMISATPGVLLAVLTADCVPALLVATRRRVAAVVHAGWRGTLAGIVLRAVEALHACFDVDVGEIEAAFGPAIGGCCYEVEREIGERFCTRWGKTSPAVWQASGAKGKLDLRGANAQLLRRTGVPMTQIHTVGPCTRCMMADYFSHRGSNGHTGRQLSYIGWRA